VTEATSTHDPCLIYGEPTDSGPLYSDRRTVEGPGGTDGYLCSFSAETLAVKRRKGKKRDELRGNLQYVIPAHTPFTH